MLSVAIHKDIAEYQPKVIGKLTGRTLISITVALGLSIAVAVYMNLVLKIDPTDHLEFIYAVSLPCWCCGFWKPHGLPQACWKYWQSKWYGPSEDFRTSGRSDRAKQERKAL